MTPRDLVLNFVNQYDKPFDAALIANMTGLEIKEVEPIITELLEDKTIKLASKREPIYARSNRFNTNVDRQMRPNWHFDPKAALALINLIERRRFTSIRSIAEVFGRSRQWVFKYLEALISVDAIGIRKAGYYVTCYENMYKVGTVITKGIIKQKRLECGIKYTPNRKKKTKSKNHR